ncbi:cation antiporter [Oleiphilus messinensis]|uniref:Cation antiporter n=1 Tax=Oleiphilus messinensis TaxID=141451 RepID=A0A1Y0IBA1_9GAMM|nr:Na+/H+ antiporter subunit E [Oleiphilus messinensis]ARU57778.1 cation antiporter [Oleiphilus messinensis]
MQKSGATSPSLPIAWPHILGWGAALTVFWLLLSGMFIPLMLFFGGLSIVLVLCIVKRMDTIDGEIKSVYLGPKLMLYCAWLVAQIVKSSYHVVRLVWSKKPELSPTVALISTDRNAELGRVLYVNSITLTPGTLSIDIVDDVITVHALDKQSIQDLESGDMERRIAKVREG